MLTINGCKTPPKNEIVLPPLPQRQVVEIPATIKDYAALVLYYDTLVQEWELWADAVQNIMAIEK